MSEYQSRHNVWGLIGATRGYKNSEEGGILTEKVAQHPHSVLLLDEIEKAHPQIFNIFLQVMDNGALTDGTGKTVDFRNVILIMTSNAGAADAARAPMGFGREDRAGEEMEAVEDLFTPEFRGRLDAIVPFGALKPPTVERIVDKFIDALTEQLSERGVAVKLRPAARAHLAEAGHDAKLGARPRERVIAEKVKQPLAEEILFGKLSGGGTATVDLKDGALTFSCRARRKTGDKKKKETE